jgi:hypothetical protein
MGSSGLNIEFEDDEAEERKKAQEKQARLKKQKAMAAGADLEFAVDDGASEGSSPSSGESSAPKRKKPSAKQEVGSNVVPLKKEASGQSSAGAAQNDLQTLIALALAESRTFEVAEQVGRAKVLEHQVNSLVNTMFKKAPALKGELTQLKKIISEYAKTESFTEVPKKKDAA